MTKITIPAVVASDADNAASREAPVVTTNDASQQQQAADAEVAQMEEAFLAELAGLQHVSPERYRPRTMAERAAWKLLSGHTGATAAEWDNALETYDALDYRALLRLMRARPNATAFDVVVEFKLRDALGELSRLEAELQAVRAQHPYCPH